MKKLSILLSTIIFFSFLTGCIDTDSEVTASPDSSIQPTVIPVSVIPSPSTSAPAISPTATSKPTAKPTPAQTPEATSTPTPASRLANPLTPRQVLNMLVLSDEHEDTRPYNGYCYNGLAEINGYYIFFWENPGVATDTTFTVDPYTGQIYNMGHKTGNVVDNIKPDDIGSFDTIPADLSNWLGYYSYKEDNPGSRETNYKICLYSEDNKYFANIYKSQYLTETRIKAEIIGTEDYITLIFIDNLPDNKDTQYRVGEELITFTREHGSEYHVSQSIILNDNNSENIFFHKNAEDLYPQINSSDFIITDGDLSLGLCNSTSVIYDAKTLNKENFHLVTERIVNNWLYKYYWHDYTSLAVYTTNEYWDLRDTDINSGYFISQINLKTDRFETARGIKIGSSVNDIILKYGEPKIGKSEDYTYYSYYYYHMNLSFTIEGDGLVTGISLNSNLQNHKSLIHLPAYEAVLMNIAGVETVLDDNTVYKMGANEYISKEATDDMSPYGITNPTSSIRFAIIDIDNDGSPEIALNYNDTDYEYLDYCNGAVYIYQYGVREAGQVKTDGTVFWSNSATNAGFGQLLFSDGISEMLTTGYFENFMNSDGIIEENYYLFGKSVSKAEYNQEANKKLILEPDWQYLNKTNIINILRIYYNREEVKYYVPFY